jgi:hypothetical protein
VERAQRDEHGRLHYQPQAGDVVILRRPHVCGADRMAVTFVGLDVRLRCSGCEAQIVLSRERLSGRVREVEISPRATPESP